MGKNFAISLLALVMVFSFSQPSFASTEEVSQSTVKAEDGSELGFGTPKSQAKSLLEFESRVNENTVEQIITIEPANSKSTLDVELELQDGDYIVLAKDEQGNADGAATIYNAQDESIGIVSSPVVENKENLNISSVDLKDGNILQFSLESEELGEPSNVVVALAAPTYSSYFSSGTWINRDGLISLSMKHKKYLFSGSTNDRAMKVGDSWNKLKAKHSGNAKWKNTNGMRDQYYCHYGTIGAAKNPWNLEPARKDVGYAMTVRYGCNPPLK